MTQKEMQQLVKRYSSLLCKDKQPETRDEDIFMKFYESGLIGTNLIEEITDKGTPNDLYEIDFVAIILGYALGQSYGYYTFNGTAN